MVAICVPKGYTMRSNEKKYYTKNCRKFLPPPGGGFDVGLEKNLSFFADYKGKN